jgi:arginase
MNVGIIGAPVDLGADRRGVDMGASAIRYAGLESHLQQAGFKVRDFGNIAAPVAESEDSNPVQLKYLEPILAMSRLLADAVDRIVREGYLPVVLGGDHSVSLGSVAGVTRHKRVGIVWLDAHGDFNQASTTPSGNIHGMVLAALAGRGDERLAELDGRSPKVEPQNVALIGARDLDPGERSLLVEAAVHVFTMHDIDRRGMPAVVEDAVGLLDPSLDGIHVSLDLDVVDPLQAPGVGTPVLGGLSYRETHLALELLAETRQITSMDVVEVNPVLDSRNATAQLAVGFILSAMGKRIL